LSRSVDRDFASSLTNPGFLRPGWFLLRGGRVALAVALLGLVFPGLDSAWLPVMAQGRVEQLERRLQDDPEDVETLLAMAMEYATQRRYVDAVQAYFRVLRLDPANFHAYNNLGILYKRMGQFADSLHCYRQAQRLRPDSFEAAYNMGMAFEAMGQIQEAREQYGRSLSLNPDFGAALIRLRELQEEPGRVTRLPSPPVPVDPGIVAKPPDRPTVNPPDLVRPPKAPAERPLATGAAALVPTKPAGPSPLTPRPEGTRIAPRTTRTGPAAMLFNQAMAAYEKRDLDRAIEWYVRGVLAERDLLAEPEGGLILEGLMSLQDRPNRMPHGLFYRGFLKTISRGPHVGLEDLRTYLTVGAAADRDETYVVEARGIVERDRLRQAAIDAEQARLASEAAIVAAARLASSQGSGIDPDLPVAPPASPDKIGQMNADEVINEANRFLRDNRTREAIGVLRTAIERDPDNIKLLMTVANAYVDLLLMKNDRDAGQLAREVFIKINRLAEPESREVTISNNMIQELDKRLK
jgi:tetratricopeptide (TPR) repeat protein